MIQQILVNKNVSILFDDKHYDHIATVFKDKIVCEHAFSLDQIKAILQTARTMLNDEKLKQVQIEKLDIARLIAYDFDAYNVLGIKINGELVEADVDEELGKRRNRLIYNGIKSIRKFATMFPTKVNSLKVYIKRDE